MNFLRVKDIDGLERFINLEHITIAMEAISEGQYCAIVLLGDIEFLFDRVEFSKILNKIHPEIT